jgi:hypothetical protein
MGYFMLRIASSLILLVTFSTVNAQQFSVNEKPVRLWGGSTGVVSKFVGPTGEATVNGGWLDTGLSYQFNDNFFGQISYTKNRVDSVIANGETTNFDDSWTSKGIGIGYRHARSSVLGKYFGVAYYHDIGGDESEETSGLISLFMEKDTKGRFGRFGISRSTQNASGTAFGGTHVWFLKSGLGLGFDWSYETGTESEMFDTEIKYVETTGGLLLMYRM